MNDEFDTFDSIPAIFHGSAILKALAKPFQRSSYLVLERSVLKATLDGCDAIDWGGSVWTQEHGFIQVAIWPKGVFGNLVGDRDRYPCLIGSLKASLPDGDSCRITTIVAFPRPVKPSQTFDILPVKQKGKPTQWCISTLLAMMNGPPPARHLASCYHLSSTLRSLFSLYALNHEMEGCREMIDAIWKVATCAQNEHNLRHVATLLADVIGQGVATWRAQLEALVQQPPDGEYTFPLMEKISTRGLSEVLGEILELDGVELH